MTIAYKYFEERIAILEMNFGFKVKAELLPFIYAKLKHLDKEQFDNNFNLLLQKTRKEWNEIFDYGKTPTIEDWKNFFTNKKQLTLEEIAKIEVDLDLEAEKYISQFMMNETILVERAKQEGWLGEPWAKSSRGLLGYMRYSYALQIKFLKELTQPVRAFSNDITILNFFKSDFFKNEVLKNGKVKAFYKAEHFDIIKNKKL